MDGDLWLCWAGTSILRGIFRSSYQTRSLDESREERRSLLRGLMEELDAHITSYDVAGLAISVRENLE